jgi:hypothetical protein
MTTPGVEPGLSRPQRNVLTTRRCGPCINFMPMSPRSSVRRAHSPCIHSPYPSHTHTRPPPTTTHTHTHTHTHKHTQTHTHTHTHNHTHRDTQTHAAGRQRVREAPLSSFYFRGHMASWKHIRSACRDVLHSIPSVLIFAAQWGSVQGWAGGE